LGDRVFHHIWEPSAGTGEFVTDVLARYPAAEVVVSEVDEVFEPGLVALCGGRAGVEIGDSLAAGYEERFDLVVGNPPYFETKIAPELRKRYASVMSGRPNVYGLFVKAGLDALRPGGVLAFVVPPSMNNGAYFKALRRDIVSRADILAIETFKEDQFEGAQQSVMVLVLQKGDNTGRYVFRKGEALIFSEQWESLAAAFDEGRTLTDLGYSVITGPVVWNQHKERLRAAPDGSTAYLVWSHNLVDGRVRDSDRKPQYVVRGKPIRVLASPAILVNRIVGAVGSGTIRAAVWDSDVPFTAENHVNVVVPTTEWARENIHRVCEALRSPAVSAWVRRITGNVQVSKTELEKMVPIQIAA
jgi:adenine-specific DNA-methyltransferase